MPAPDVLVQILSAPTTRTDATDTGQAFFVGESQRGDPTQPIVLHSMADFNLRFGGRLATSSLYDAAETYFAEGGQALYVSRAVGAAAAAAGGTAFDGSAGLSLNIHAGSYGVREPGTWGNNVSFAILTSADDAVTIPSGTYVVQVLYNGVEVERSYPSVTQADAINWARTRSQYVVIEKGSGSLPPVRASAVALGTGTDVAAADSDRQAALDRISGGYGPGQVAMPGLTTSVAHLQLLAHAQAKQRFALLDAPDTATYSTLIALAQADQAAPNNGRRWGQLFAPWDIIPGLTAITVRTVPPSARAAAQYARIDALGNPNQPAAGKYGQARYVQDLSQPAWDSPTRGALNDAGVTVSRRIFPNLIQTYGYRSLADQINDPQWSNSANVRTIMWLAARGKTAAATHEFQQIDPQGQTLAALRGDLMGLCSDLYLRGALYGKSPAEAFFVDTGPAVNPPAQLAQGIAAVNMAVRPSPSPERIIVSLVNVPITQALA